MADTSQNFWGQFRSVLEEGQTPETLYKDLILDAKQRPVTYEEFYYLLSCYPFLDICSVETEAQSLEGRIPEKIIAKSGWEIQDFGDRLRGSAASTQQSNQSAYRKYPLDGSEDDSGESRSGSAGGIEKPPYGSLVQQFVDTAGEMVALAIEKGWPGANVVSGFYGMVRAAWIAADSQKFLIIGFEPTMNDRVVKTWVEKLSGTQLQKIPALTKNKTFSR